MVIALQFTAVSRLPQCSYWKSKCEKAGTCKSHKNLAVYPGNLVQLLDWSVSRKHNSRFDTRTNCLCLLQSRTGLTRKSFMVDFSFDFQISLLLTFWHSHTICEGFFFVFFLANAWLHLRRPKTLTGELNLTFSELWCLTGHFSGSYCITRCSLIMPNETCVAPQSSEPRVHILTWCQGQSHVTLSQRHWQFLWRVTRY